jgi:arabinofuranosyltransferase
MGTVLEDAIVLLIPFAFFFVTLVTKASRFRVISLGIFIYFLYLLYIGGDFMMGRHFTVAFFIATFCLIFSIDRRHILFENGEKVGINVSGKSFQISRKLVWTIATLVFFQSLVGMFHVSIIHLVNVAALRFDPCLLNPGNGDERAFWSRFSSLPKRIYYHFSENEPALRYQPLIDVIALKGQRELNEARAANLKGDIIKYAPGVLVYYDADGLYVNDWYALGDPYLARMPIYKPKGFWLIGHFFRRIPEGYRESVRTGKTQVQDAQLAEYLDILWEITRSEDLFSSSRIEKIININLGRYRHLLTKFKQEEKEASYVIEREK